MSTCCLPDRHGLLNCIPAGYPRRGDQTACFWGDDLFPFCSPPSTSVLPVQSVDILGINRLPTFRLLALVRRTCLFLESSSALVTKPLKTCAWSEVCGSSWKKTSGRCWGAGWLQNLSKTNKSSRQVCWWFARASYRLPAGGGERRKYVSSAPLLFALETGCVG